MSRADAITLLAGPDAPTVRLLDARRGGLDEAALRAWARAEAEAGAPYVSRSYRFPYALVAWHTAPLGVDIERVEPFDPAFVESICTPQERGLLPRGGKGGGFQAALWSSKEALAKALGNALAYDPGRLGSPLFWPGGQAGPWRARSLPVPDGHNGWLCWRS